MKHFFFAQKSLLSAAFCFFAAGFLNLAAAQTANFQTVDAMPEAEFFPNPASLGASIKLRIVESVPNERAVFAVKILNEKGQVIFAAPMPDELELVLDGQRFAAGIFITQFYESGRLFEQDELLVR